MEVVKDQPEDDTKCADDKCSTPDLCRKLNELSIILADTADNEDDAKVHVDAMNMFFAWYLSNAGVEQMGDIMARLTEIYVNEQLFVTAQESMKRLGAMMQMAAPTPPAAKGN